MRALTLVKTLQEMAVLSESLRHFKSRIGSIVWVRDPRRLV